jgi:biopolymer transport protein ExbD
MSEIQTKDSGGGKKKKGGSKQKKISVFVDFTPMVDMNMLLITFFMLCTSLSKPQTMEISMPSNDKKITEADKSMVKASQAVTLLLTGGDSIFYYTGQPDYKDYNSLKLSSYKPSGIRSFLLKRNSDAVSKIDDLKQKKLQLKINQEQFTKEVAEIKNGKNTPVVIIKATDKATYKNLVDALDEMQICNIGKYVIDTIASPDKFLLRNRAAKGALSRAGGK